MQKKRSLRQYIVDYLVITLGSALMALAVNYFLEPWGIVPGGVTGIAMMVNHLFSAIPIGVAIIVINVPLFLLSWRFAGHRFLIYTIYGTLTSSIFIDLAQLLPSFEVDMLLSAVFGGLVMGAGLGFVFTRGATTGGSDIAARLLKLLMPHMQMGRLMLCVDLAIVAAAGFVFGSLNNVFYAIITLYVSTAVMDAVLYGPNVARVAFIISDHVTDIVKVIDSELGRGATLLHGEGSYTGDPKKVVLCAVKRQQIAQLKEVVKSVDPNAFIILSEAHEVLGEGFRDYDKHAL